MKSKLIYLFILLQAAHAHAAELSIDISNLTRMTANLACEKDDDELQECFQGYIEAEDLLLSTLSPQFYTTGLAAATTYFVGKHLSASEKELLFAVKEEAALYLALDGKTILPANLLAAIDTIKLKTNQDQLTNDEIILMIFIYGQSAEETKI